VPLDVAPFEPSLDVTLPLNCIGWAATTALHVTTMSIPLTQLARSVMVRDLPRMASGWLLNSSIGMQL